MEMEIINHVTISGRLVADPKVKTTKKGTSILSCTIEQIPTRYNRDTKKREEIEPQRFFVSKFGAGADELRKALGKGALVIVSGKLQQSRWEYMGETHSRVEIAASEVVPVQEKQPDRPFEAQAAPDIQNSAEAAGFEDFDDDFIEF